MGKKRAKRKIRKEVKEKKEELALIDGEAIEELDKGKEEVLFCLFFFTFSHK